MTSGCAHNTVVATRQRARTAVAAASAILLTFALAACEPSAPSSTPAPTATRTATGDASPSPVPTPEPLILPGCDTMLPLSTAKGLLSPDTVVLGDDDVVPVRGEALPEIDAAASNATIAKNCIWGIPNSSGGFVLVVADITETDAENLKSALLATGFLGATSGDVTTLEISSETGVGTQGITHYFVGDLWIYVLGTSLGLTTDVADNALSEVRLANPTRTY